MASIQQINGDYYGSKETLTETLPFITKKNVYSASVNNFFGIADKELAIYDDAIYYYKEAIKDCTDSLSIQSPLNNIAAVYIQQKKYDKAIQILESISTKKILDDSSLKETKARVIDNLGYAYFKNGRIEKGLTLILESLTLRNQIDDVYGSIFLTSFHPVETKVYICGPTGAKKYHYNENCRGLTACRHVLTKVTLAQTQGYGLTLCGWED